ncbi:MAG: zf-HC2 domain-containing protein [candidate division Zixibacteria bacterium]|nr:zf-HC2 domain-containing protein [candidate division Zixibacteria bacterium]
MKCSKCRDLLDDYIRGWLDISRAKEIDNHLAVCRECAAEYESHKDLLSILESEPELVIESSELADFVPGIWQKIEKNRKIPLSGWLFKLVPSLATALLLSFFILKPPVDISINWGSYQEDTETYSDSDYFTLLGSLLSEKDVETLALFENELYFENQLYSNNYLSYFELLSDEELELFENKLSKLFNDAG